MLYHERCQQANVRANYPLHVIVPPPVAIRRRLAQVPGIAFGLSQPIAMRVDELVSGVRSQVAVKLFGDELEMLRAKADEIAWVMR